MKMHRLYKLLRRFDRDTKGSVLIYTAFAISGLLGMVALGVDVGTWYSARRDMQSAADAGAMLAAFNKEAGAAPGAVTAAGEDGADDNGYLHGDGTTLVTVENPPLSGNFVGFDQYVTVSVQEESPSYLSAALEIGAVNVAATATAAAGQDSTCLVVLNESMNNALQVNLGDLQVLDCGITVNSNSPIATSVSVGSSIDVTGDGELCIRGTRNAAIGGDYLNDGIAQDPREGCQKIPDPLAGLTEPVSGACNDAALPNFGPPGDHILFPGTYCNSVNLLNANNVLFNPGLYVFEEGLNFQGQNITANGVTFYFGDDPNAVLSTTVASNITITAPIDNSLDGVPGVAIFSSRSYSGVLNHSLRGAGTLTIEGAIYSAATGVAILGASTTNTAPFTFIVADNFQFSGNSSFTLGGFDGSGTVPSPVDLDLFEVEARLVD